MTKLNEWQNKTIRQALREKRKKKITIHDKHIFRPSKTETIWYKNAFRQICSFDAGTPQSCGLMESEAVHIKKEESKMPRGVYPRHKQATKKQKKNNRALAFVNSKNAEAIQQTIKDLTGNDLTDQQLDMPFTDLIQQVDDALGLSKIAVNHPAHYGGDTPYEVIKVAEHWLTREEFIGAMKFQVFKYTPRAGKKNPSTEVQDHEKSIWYHTYLIDFLKRNPKV